MTRTEERKTALTEKEAVKAAYLHIVRGWTQSDIAVAFEVNIGRVNEAITAIRNGIKGGGRG